jgi:hypothetical protein
MINCSFLPVFYEHHQCKKTGKTIPDFENYSRVENIWMSFYGLGLMETYQFIYGQCTSISHLQEWLIDLKGEEQVRESAAAFAHWNKQENTSNDVEYSLLSEAQLESWKQYGYIKVSNLVDEHLCDAVIQLICRQLGADLSVSSTWYNSHPDWHGLMLLIYQDESINAIRTLPAIKQLFAELYGTSNIIANTEKVSFNPPETDSWKFSHNKLHWDIDFNKPVSYHIQGLVYLNDVPEDRGPLTLVPEFHHQFDDWLQTHSDPQQLMTSAIGVPGKKGDVVLWLQTLPHAASSNHSDLPRFVQYVSFSKL